MVSGRWMSDGEIVRSYKHAKKPHKQIKILADLNATSEDEIIKIIGEVEMAKKNINWTPELDAQVDKWREEGVTWGEIGERIGCSKKAAAMRYYNRNKPVHIPTTKPEETVTRRNEPESPDNVPDKEYPGLLRLWAELLYGETHKTDKTAKTARTLMRGAAARYELLLNTQKPTAVEPNINVDELLGSHDALYMHAIQIRTLTDILHLVLQGAEGGQKHYDRLMSQLDFMFDALSETADTLKTEVGALEDTIIKISPEAATSKADKEETIK